MESIIHALEEKNSFLQKFVELNSRGLTDFHEGNFDCIDEFYNAREGILSIVQKLDELIERDNSSCQYIENISPEHKKVLIQLLDRKNDLVTHILSQDLQILSLIEEAKSQIIKELSETKLSRKAIGSYKSTGL